jgi:uncharacterized membrane protein
VTASSAALRDAALLGGVSGMRTLMGPAVLAAHGRIQRQPTRYMLLAAALGELAGDKHPAASSRTAPPALAGRIVSGAVCGRIVAGGPGAALGAGVALAATFACHRVRAELAAKVPDPYVGAAEDVLAISLAWLATPRNPQGGLTPTLKGV